MNSVLTLSGWSLCPQSLSSFLPGAVALDYATAKGYEDVAERYRALNQSFEVLVGWSLGAQLACRLVAAGVAKPRRLVLIAAPFQHVQSLELNCGISPFLFDTFRNNYATNPVRTLNKFALMNHESTPLAKKLQRFLDQNPERYEHWLRWLDELGRYSCVELDFTHFPQTTMVHAADDLVIPVSQVNQFQQRLSHCDIVKLESGGHTPHIHDEALLARIIEGYHDSI